MRPFKVGDKVTPNENYTGSALKKGGVYTVFGLSCQKDNGLPGITLEGFSKHAYHWQHRFDLVVTDPPEAISIGCKRLVAHEDRAYLNGESFTLEQAQAARDWLDQYIEWEESKPKPAWVPKPGEKFKLQEGKWAPVFIRVSGNYYPTVRRARAFDAVSLASGGLVPIWEYELPKLIPVTDDDT